MDHEQAPRTEPDIQFPCESIPPDANAARLTGLYAQRQEGLWMQRVKVLGGRLTTGQWQAMALAAVMHTPGTDLHLTTRQDIEFHDVRADRVPALQRDIADARLTTVGACGDTLRNITICPCSGAAGGLVNLEPLAWQIRNTLEAAEGIYALPRKLKIALACGDACGQPWINDLALVARQRDGRWGFRAIGAGSLGAKPATGIELYEWIPADDALPLALAIMQVHAKHSDREHRTRARLRHVRERLGDDAFRRLLDDAFGRARADRAWPDVHLHAAPGGFEASMVLNFVTGDVNPQAAEALGLLAGRSDIHVRIANHHRVVLFGASADALRRAVASHESLAEAARPQPSIVACPGRTWCKRALTDTRKLAQRLQERWTDLPAGATVCISGCPNGCAHSAVADVGLIGRAVSRNGDRCEAYDVLTGGGMGRDERLATPLLREATPADLDRPPQLS